MPSNNNSDRSVKYEVFFDFDNTIAPYDVLDDLLAKFSVDNKWQDLEELWRSGKIGSKDCLDGQLKTLRIRKKDLLEYLKKIKISRYFNRTLTILKKHNIDFAVLSDNFGFIIENILRNNGVDNIRIIANKLNFRGNKIIPQFPYFNKKCPRCANCKTQNLPNSRLKKIVKIYVGDGLSDICPAGKADLVFAKDSLLKYCNDNNIRCIPFRDLKRIYYYFKFKEESENEQNN